ncbi:hypothetical protein VTK26DRAFT_467 [Humicola hyalothermophila]
MPEASYPYPCAAGASTRSTHPGCGRLFGAWGKRSQDGDGCRSGPSRSMGRMTGSASAVRLSHNRQISVTLWWKWRGISAEDVATCSWSGQSGIGSVGMHSLVCSPHRRTSPWVGTPHEGAPKKKSKDGRMRQKGGPIRCTASHRDDRGLGIRWCTELV